VSSLDIVARVLLFGFGGVVGYIIAWLALGTMARRSPTFRAFLWGMIERHGSPIEIAEYAKSPINQPFCAACGKAAWQHASTGFKGIPAISGHDFIDPTEPK